MKKKLAIAIIGKEGGGLRVGAVVSGELVSASKTVGEMKGQVCIASSLLT